MCGVAVGALLSRRIGVGLWSCRTARTLESSHARPACRQSTLGGCAQPRPLRCASRRCRAAFGQLLLWRGRGEGRARVPLSSRDRVGQAALTGRGERPGANRGCAFRKEAAGAAAAGPPARWVRDSNKRAGGETRPAPRAVARWPAAPGGSIRAAWSRTIRQTQPHSAALSRTLLHSAALCCTLLHSAAIFRPQ